MISAAAEEENDFSCSVPVNSATTLNLVTGSICLIAPFLHILPDAIESLTSSCLGDEPAWGDFPMVGVVSMSAMILTMIESFASSYMKRLKSIAFENKEEENKKGDLIHVHNQRQHDHNNIRRKLLTHVLESGIVSAIFWQVSTRQCLHVGHDECELSHLSIHRTWNPWWHVGSSFTRSSDTNSERHMTHSVSRPGRFRSAACTDEIYPLSEFHVCLGEEESTPSVLQIKARFFERGNMYYVVKTEKVTERKIITKMIPHMRTERSISTVSLRLFSWVTGGDGGTARARRRQNRQGVVLGRLELKKGLARPTDG
ncbi:hypothetical protein HID58_028586 [Brassica napus]|uniref:Uncharacterized protein n=1 Tax=Brassica napus TaxID=3708 RepID=A0ABQ8CCK8_BRANA|nr:hypothetical protein HID58_028586 [Brassica napus]